MPFDLQPLAALWLGFACFGAALVRGYSGFGFSALVVAAAGLVTNPLNVVAVVLLGELILSAQAWRGIKGQVQGRMVWLLLAGAALGMPIGLWALLSIPEAAALAVISGFVLIMCLILHAGWRMEAVAGSKGILAVGFASGLANGPGMGGLPVAAFFAAQPMPASVFRATLVAYFPLLDLYSLPLYAWAGLITADTFWAFLFTLPLILLGNALGSRRFLAADPQEFRRFAIWLLALLALLGLGKALLGALW